MERKFASAGVGTGVGAGVGADAGAEVGEAVEPLQPAARIRTNKSDRLIRSFTSTPPHSHLQVQAKEPRRVPRCCAYGRLNEIRRRRLLRSWTPIILAFDQPPPLESAGNMSPASWQDPARSALSRRRQTPFHPAIRTREPGFPIAW